MQEGKCGDLEVSSVVFLCGDLAQTPTNTSASLSPPPLPTRWGRSGPWLWPYSPPFALSLCPARDAIWYKSIIMKVQHEAKWVWSLTVWGANDCNTPALRARAWLCEGIWQPPPSLDYVDSETQSQIGTRKWQLLTLACIPGYAE